MSEIMQQVKLNDTNESVCSLHRENKAGFSLRDMQPNVFNKLYRDAKSQRMHDANFAFVMTKLSKLHQTPYEPQYNITYAQDVPIDVGGGMVDFVDRFSIEWAGMPTQQQNLTGNNVNIIPRANAKVNHEKVNVHNYEVAYDIKFIEIDKLEKVQFQKSIEAIYKDAIMAGWDMFCDRMAYEGTNGTNGLINNTNVQVTVLPQGTYNAAEFGFKAMTDSEIVSTINGILTHYLINSNMNIALLPDKILLPVTDASELTSRFSSLYTSTLRRFLTEFNIGADEAQAAGVNNYTLKISGRPRLNGAGSLKGGRIVAYKMDKKYVRMDIPYPIQVYYTAPNIERACYTTIFVGQISDVQLPYNSSSSEIGAVTYWDFTPATGTIKYDKNGGTGTVADTVDFVGDTVTLASNSFTAPSGKTFSGWATSASASAKDYSAGDEIVMPYGTTTLYAIWA